MHIYQRHILHARKGRADATAHTNDAGSTLPLGLEIRHATFAFNREDPLGQIIFLRYRIYNRGGNTLNNLYISLWCDPDLGGATDDFVGCDTILSLGYCYNATNNDGDYGNNPPAVGYDFFQGPLIPGVAGDVAKMWGTTFPGMKNMPLITFNKYINGTDPNDFGESYNYMQGLNADGTPYEFPPNSGTNLLFVHSGDPVARTGDLDASPADRRFMMSVGPLNWVPGDSTEILAGIIVGRGSDRVTSVSVMKFFDQFAQLAYDSNFVVPDPPRAPVLSVSELNGEVSIYWTDTSEVDHGDYPFEGYTVFQGESAVGPWKRVVNYDVDNGIGTILDSVINIQTGVLEVVGVKFGSDPGVQRNFSTTFDEIQGAPLRNSKEYFYRVEAYSFNPAALPATLTSASVVTVTPQGE